MAQAHIESVVLQVFNWADREDRNGVFNKYVDHRISFYVRP